jgi:beta-fructofuranosidase
VLRRPDGRRPFGDAIPYYNDLDGTYHLFYLSPRLDADSSAERLDGVTWEHVSSPDLRNWSAHPSAILPGPPGSVDEAGALTGCVIRAGDVWHVFYVGASAGEYPQTICHATSVDLEVFTKDSRNPILIPDDDHFERGDWRDPFVFWNEEATSYWMLISARSTVGPAARRGVIALAISSDLDSWEISPEPFLSPMMTLVPECADLTRMGDQWVLSFSSYTGSPGLHYYTAPHTSGPWSPAPSFTDGAGWYAAKSLSDPDGRLLSFGWIPG